MTVEQRTFTKVAWRIMPFLMLCYFFNYLDKVNVGFAALDMNKALGLSASVFGFGAGVFFVAYAASAMPSNMMLVRFGARRWIGTILVVWGLLAAAMMFVVGPKSFYVMRFLLGGAEAGLYPASIYFMSTWFPVSYRGRTVSYFMATSSVAAAIGAPISTSLLYLHGIWGLQGWQWLFLLEGLPTILIGVFAFAFLTDRPSDAKWLQPEERNWLQGRLATEDKRREKQIGDLGAWQTIMHPKVLALGIVEICINCLLFGIGFFLPTIVKGFGLTNFQTGWLLILPPALGTVAMLYWGRRSDKKLERRKHLVGAYLVAAAGTILAATTSDPVIRMTGLTISQVGMFASMPIFVGMPSSFLTLGKSAAIGYGCISMIGSIGAFLAPWIMGLIKDATGGYELGLALFGCLMLLAAAIIWMFGDQSALERPPGEQEQLQPTEADGLLIAGRSALS